MSARLSVTACVLVLAALVIGGCNRNGDPAVSPSPTSAMATPAPTETPGSPGSPTAAPEPDSGRPPAGSQTELFPGFWPAADLGEAKSLQRSFDEGHQPWRGDPVETARAYAREVAAWDIKVDSSERKGSSREGWSATVVFQPLIGEAEPPDFPGPRHVMSLIGLQGAEHPIWFVTGLQSSEIVVDMPKDRQPVTSPLRLAGRGRAYEGTIQVRIQDDKKVQLYPPADDPGVVQGGATELEPFDAELRFREPTAPGGTLLLRGDTGVGPAPAVTVVRLRFQG